MPISVTVWNEFFQERTNPAVAAVYPDGQHTVLAAGIAEQLGDQVAVRTAVLDEPDHGLPPALLDATDVLVWWGHLQHHLVADEVVDRIQAEVLAGMGLVMLHSGIGSKVFGRLMGTSCEITGWRHGDRELVWTVDQAHPIAQGVPNPVVIPAQEMYGEPVDIPAPDELVFISSFAGGEVLRSGCCFHRGRGRIFFFAPGDEGYPVYYQPEIRHILANAVRWAHQPHRPRRQVRAGEWPMHWWQQEAGDRTGVRR